MSNLYKLFENNVSIEKSGVPFEVSEGVIFTLKRYGGSNSKLVSAITTKHMKPHKQAIDRDALSERKENEIMASILVESCFVSMEGVTDKNGKLLESTPENAIKVLTDLPELRHTLMTYAQDVQNFNETSHPIVSDEEKEELGNS